MSNETSYDPTARTVYAEGVFLHETEKAVLVEFLHGGKCWLPKSQLRAELEIEEDSQECVVHIPAWLAEVKGIRYEELEESEDGAGVEPLDFEDDIPF